MPPRPEGVTTVVHVIDSLGVGGAEQALGLLARNLDPTRFRCRVFALRGLGPLAEDFRARNLLANEQVPSGLRAQLAGLWTFLRTERPDIVHTHLNYSDLFGGPLARAAGVPFVLSYKASILRTHGSRQRLYNAMTRWASTSDDVVVVLSAALQAYLVSHRIVPERKIRVVHYGVDLEPPQRALCRADINLRTGPVVLLPARLEPRKDHATFFKAAQHVLAHRPDAQFLLAGDGEPSFRAELEKLAAPLGSAVRFLGNRDDVPALMTLADLVVLSSTTEGLGLVLLEAMTARRPVVATRVGGVPEIVVDRVTGLLVEPRAPDLLAAAMIELLGDPVLSARMGEAGRRRVEEEFTVAAMAAKMSAVYDDLLSRRRATIPV
jgi:glycosyltransferase involved in cell wall biosynthesis